MYFRQLRLPDLGCASYIVGGEGKCAVIDPRWDAVSQYIGLAGQHNLRITHIIETHTHADHVSGASRLAGRTGATVYAHQAAPLTYPHHALTDGDSLTIGDARITVLHTPGHSMDSISLLIHDLAHDDSSGADAQGDRLLSGDTLFVGDVGRPDLHGDGAARLADALYTSIHERLSLLGDDVEVFPAHLAGSLCGKRIASDPSTSIGRERRTNPSLATMERERFVRLMLEDLPPRPPNVARIVELNRAGAPASRPPVTLVSPAEAARMLTSAIPVDGRDAAQFAKAHIWGALNAPISYGQFGLMLAWLLPPETPLLLVTQDEDDLNEARDSMMVVGMTNPVYALDSDEAEWRAAHLPVASSLYLVPAEFKQRQDAGAIGTILDVREPVDTRGGTLPGSINLPYRLLATPAHLPHLDEPVALICNSGNRSTLAASLLARHSIPTVNLAGGTSAWEEAGYPLVPAVSGSPQS